MTNENIVHINGDNWISEVLKSTIPVLTDFWAPWCGPCKTIAPILDQLANEMTGEIKIVKINVDDHPDLAQQFGIRSIPTLLIFKDGVIQEQMTGMMSKDNLKEKLNAHID